jgi:hypothetical protein
MNRNDLEVQQIEALKNQITQVKNTIKNLNARRQALSSQPVFRQGEGLHAGLSTFLPKGTVPGNVGELNKVAWQFQYTVDFDLKQTQPWIESVANVGVGALTNMTRQVSSFQVTQESAFLMMGMLRHANDYEDSGDLGPLTFQFRDAQSSRYFNNEPVPIQMIGQKGFMNYMAVPMIIMPNAKFEIELGCNLDQGVTQLVPGSASGIHRFTMFGYRIRVSDADKVLSSIFG